MTSELLNFAGADKICFIGGGSLMHSSISIFQKNGFRVSGVFAPRHKDEIIPDTGKTIEQSFCDAGVEVTIVEDINAISDDELERLGGKTALSICFGPAWVFSDRVMNAFEFGMYNINSIPIPTYLGGAHFTWQLLNRNHEGGCFFQKITARLDRGPLLAHRTFSIPSDAASPATYFEVNEREGILFLEDLARGISNGEAFEPQDYETVNEKRLYFPRLRTDKQAYINWSWSKDDIESFCAGFDDPYAGARSFLNGELVILKKVTIVDEHVDFHPFCAGLVVRKTSSQLLVCVKDGLISIGSIGDKNGLGIRSRIKEGMRLVTPVKLLEEALSYSPVLGAKGFEGA